MISVNPSTRIVVLKIPLPETTAIHSDVCENCRGRKVSLVLAPVRKLSLCWVTTFTWARTEKVQLTNNRLRIAAVANRFATRGKFDFCAKIGCMARCTPKYEMKDERQVQYQESVSFMELHLVHSLDA